MIRRFTDRFQVETGSARLTLAFAPDGILKTTHEHQGVAAKRFSVEANREEVAALIGWLVDNVR